SRLRAAAGGAQVLTGNARGKGEYPELVNTRTTLIPVTAAFGGLALFIAMFVVASTLGLSIQQREREIALLRAVAATPGQIRRMIAWEAAIVALIGSTAGIWLGIRLGRTLARALVKHGIAPENYSLHTDLLPAAAVIGCAVANALLAVLASARRAAKVSPTLALTDAAVEPRLLGPGRIIGGPLSLAGAVPLFTVATTTSTPATTAATAELTAIMLVVAVGCLGPVAARVTARLLGPPLAGLSPVGGFLASANLGAATRRFSSASTPLVLTVALSCTLLFSTTTIEHAISQERRAALTGQLAVTSAGPGLPAGALADVRATPGVRSAAALTSTTLARASAPATRCPLRCLPGAKAAGSTSASSPARCAHYTVTQSRSGATAPPLRTPASANAWSSCSATGHAPTPPWSRSTVATWPSATRCSPPSSPPATKPSRCWGRSSSRRGIRSQSPIASKASRRAIPDCV
ncbi:MAG: FtsX-like permease family protein, partial [Solirubrobacterales bacterium]|nr:FtsX-like permease family protein [Solirubrobacterales bacterium]